MYGYMYIYIHVYIYVCILFLTMLGTEKAEVQLPRKAQPFVPGRLPGQGATLRSAGAAEKSPQAS